MQSNQTCGDNFVDDWFMWWRRKESSGGSWPSFCWIEKPKSMKKWIPCGGNQLQEPPRDYAFLSTFPLLRMTRWTNQTKPNRVHWTWTRLHWRKTMTTVLGESPLVVSEARACTPNSLYEPLTRRIMFNTNGDYLQHFIRVHGEGLPAMRRYIWLVRIAMPSTLASLCRGCITVSEITLRAYEY